MTRRLVVTYLVVFAAIVVIGIIQGAPNLTLLLVQAAAYALIALGLNIQFGFGGLFNFAIMGLMMIGAMGLTSISMPINDAFWNSDGPMMLLRAIGAAAVGVVAIILVRRLPALGVNKTLSFWVMLLVWLVAYIFYRTQIDPAAAYIEKTAGWVGGLGLPVGFGWLAGGLMAGVAAFAIGKISLGLRSDYLAIATTGMSEIIRAFVKNMDWLTRGTLTVTPLPWPVPLPQDFQLMGADISMSFVLARGSFLLLLVVMLGILVFLIERAYKGAWGRTMRSIRDNHIAASSMGKNTKARQLELFVLGAVLIGVGGAILASFSQLFDPTGYQPINHSFLIWVMVIVGGAGSSYGALLGGVGIYLLWALSDPISQALFGQISAFSNQIGWGPIPEIAPRASQMRVFVLGLAITLALRYAPRGILPEVIRRDA